MTKTADLLNELYPVGTPVRYWSVMGDESYVDSKTRSIAWELGYGRAVVSIEGKSGGVAIDHLLPLVKNS